MWFFLRTKLLQTKLLRNIPMEPPEVSGGARHGKCNVPTQNKSERTTREECFQKKLSTEL